eukprot:CAMPEP_0119555458 /NCGR_PEP_ID=MMETSP1352-20130426/7663_1 /TAXON_ID=265584 /ORGANISM="Stauroneis constricta, Strain CCMP1120" /LENGTH=857 /DNA_ID=CAMNT_0007602221 /DNA_START=98 /DNA_END=2668 /DNA_ORIENTATION=+
MIATNLKTKSLIDRFEQKSTASPPPEDISNSAHVAVTIKLKSKASLEESAIRRTVHRSRGRSKDRSNHSACATSKDVKTKRSKSLVSTDPTVASSSCSSIESEDDAQKTKAKKTKKKRSKSLTSERERDGDRRQPILRSDEQKKSKKPQRSKSLTSEDLSMMVPAAFLESMPTNKRKVFRGRRPQRAKSITSESPSSLLQQTQDLQQQQAPPARGTEDEKAKKKKSRSSSKSRSKSSSTHTRHSADFHVESESNKNDLKKRSKSNHSKKGTKSKCANSKTADNLEVDSSGSSKNKNKSNNSTEHSRRGRSKRGSRTTGHHQSKRGASRSIDSVLEHDEKEDDGSSNNKGNAKATKSKSKKTTKQKKAAGPATKDKKGSSASRHSRRTTRSIEAIGLDPKKHQSAHSKRASRTIDGASKRGSRSIHGRSHSKRESRSIGNTPSKRGATRSVDRELTDHDIESAFMVDNHDFIHQLQEQRSTNSTHRRSMDKPKANESTSQHQRHNWYSKKKNANESTADDDDDIANVNTGGDQCPTIRKLEYRPGKGLRPKRSKSKTRENQVMKVKWIMERIIGDDLDMSEHTRGGHGDTTFPTTTNAIQDDTKAEDASIQSMDGDHDSKGDAKQPPYAVPNEISTQQSNQVEPDGIGDDDDDELDVFAPASRRRVVDKRKHNWMLKEDPWNAESPHKQRMLRDDNSESSSIKSFGNDFDGDHDASFMSIVQKPVKFVPQKVEKPKVAPAPKKKKQSGAIPLGKPMDPSELRKLLDLPVPPTESVRRLKSMTDDDLPVHFRDDYNHNEAIPTPFMMGGGVAESEPLTSRSCHGPRSTMKTAKNESSSSSSSCHRRPLRMMKRDDGLRT